MHHGPQARTPLAAAVAQLGGAPHAIGVRGRADDPEHQAEAVAAAVDAFGRLDVLVNNTGINPAFGPLTDLDDVGRPQDHGRQRAGRAGVGPAGVAAGLGAAATGAIVNMASDRRAGARRRASPTTA